MRFKFIRQRDMKDCGPTCLQMVARYYGRNIPIQKLRDFSFVSHQGATLLSLSSAAEKIGFVCNGARLTVDRLEMTSSPCILHWSQGHYVVLIETKGGIFRIADPSAGIISLKKESFLKLWYGNKNLAMGVALLMEPTDVFYDQKDVMPVQLSWKSFLFYLIKYKALFFQLTLAITASSVLTLITPFFTQTIVDIGLNTRDIGLVYIVLFAQLMLFLGSTSVNFLRSWILLHISARINMLMLSDFLVKLLNLPSSFFESKTTGDIMTRMEDHRTVETFLTTSTLSTIFTLFNAILFTFILLHYDSTIFGIAIIGNLVYAGWLSIFFKKRRQLNYKQFEINSSNSSNVIELIKGIQEVKLHNAENMKRLAWEKIQALHFKFKIQSLSLTQVQQGGTLLINQIKNLLITFISVKAVMNGELSVGGMMAIQYIVGQLSNPVEQLLEYLQSFQDTMISLERINDIHAAREENYASDEDINTSVNNGDIIIDDLTFFYPGAKNLPVLKNVSLRIPYGTTTAIVGLSGSGKTTLLKLLLRYYESDEKAICVGEVRMNSINPRLWRAKCGTVMHDGFIFTDTIANNIMMDDPSPDDTKLMRAIEVANLNDYIARLPFGVHTRLGAAGSGLSHGQRQRILIARAVYKNPSYLFFDEATNALDSKNESKIIGNLNQFFTNRTVVIVAHRLSTIRHADNIVVMRDGEIVEQGRHLQLLEAKGEYYDLVQTQLELAF